jgi:hypothetical protein
MAKSNKQKTTKKAAAATKKTPSHPGRSSHGKPASARDAGRPAQGIARAGNAKASIPPPPVMKEDPKAVVGIPAKRKLGLRGAAPWAARHAAKHAAEARARAAEPAPPGSARATIRVPTGAEEIKAKVAELHNQVQKIRNFKKRYEKGFFDIGQVLIEIQHQELYLAKGYGSFEAFLEREIHDIGKQTSLKLMKIAHLFQREAALDYGTDRLFAAIAALEGDATMPKPSQPSTPGRPPPLPLKPPMRIVG